MPAISAAKVGVKIVASDDLDLLPAGQQWLVVQLEGTKPLSANTRYWLEITATRAAKQP